VGFGWRGGLRAGRFCPPRAIVGRAVFRSDPCCTVRPVFSKVRSARRIYREGGGTELLTASRNYFGDRILHNALVETELATKDYFDLSWSRRVALYRRGFLSQADALYDFASNDHADYVTDYQRWARTPRINGEARYEVIDKYRFHGALEAFDEHRPEVFGRLDGGKYYAEPGAAPAPMGALSAALRSERRLVLKPVTGGGGGEGVVVCSTDGERYVAGGRSMSESEFEAWLASLDEYLVMEFVDQADYADALYPDAANTTRIVTMIDEDGPFAAVIAHRIGTDGSAPLDNWSAGGLSASIRDDGTLTRATRYPYGGKLEWFADHPDTGSRIAERTVPNWDSIREKVLRMTGAMSHVPYIAWDMLPTDDGFKILEGNAHTDVDLLQVHEPLLADDRVRRFYRRHGVV